MRIALAAALLALAPAAQADCPKMTAFSCDIKKKALEVCLDGGLVSYAFGPAGAPELELTTRVEQAEYVPWGGVGRSIYEEVTFRNGPYGYLVWTANDRQILDDTSPAKVTGGVIVSKAGKQIAALDCTPFTIENGIDALWEAKERAGQCWSREDFAWASCSN